MPWNTHDAGSVACKNADELFEKKIGSDATQQQGLKMGQDRDPGKAVCILSDAKKQKNKKKKQKRLVIGVLRSGSGTRICV